MRAIIQQEKEMPVADEIAQERQIEPDMINMHWRNRRYDYYCGGWRYDWHKKVPDAQAAIPQVEG